MEPTKDNQPPRPIVQTYEDDLARAMDATEAGVVQELLETAREREAIETERTTRTRERGWYTAGGLILMILALGFIGYGAYYYTHLTVNVVAPATVGVFPSITPVVASTTTIKALRDTLTTDTEIILPGKPTLVPLVTDEKTLTPINPDAFFAFMGARASEPFIATLTLARLGIMNTGDSVVPFLIFSVPNTELAAKEFLIAEPKLLEMVAPVLGIDLSLHTEEIGKGFESRYMYNLPVRTLTSVDPDTQISTILFYYAFATDHTVVISTDPTVLKAIYDTIIRQR